MSVLSCQQSTLAQKKDLLKLRAEAIAEEALARVEDEFLNSVVLKKKIWIFFCEDSRNQCIGEVGGGSQEETSNVEYIPCWKTGEGQCNGGSRDRKRRIEESNARTSYLHKSLLLTMLNTSGTWKGNVWGLRGK